MKMHTQIILLLFGLATIAAHTLKEPDVNPCIQEYQEPPRKFTNGHGFQYLYRRRPLEFVKQRPGKIQDAVDVTVSSPAPVQSITKISVPTPAEAQSTKKVTVPTPAVVQSTTKVTVPTTTQPIRYVDDVTVPAVSTSKPKTDKVTATKNRRNNMFNAMRERYNSNKNKKSTSSDDRQKREVNYKAIPEAPTLPELDIQALPEYVQKMLASNPTFENRNKTVNREQNSDKMQNDMDKLFSNDSEIDKKPRTYGMKLNNGLGYSWNEIAGAPNIIIQTTLVPSVLMENAENKTITIINDIMEPINDISVDKNNSDGPQGLGHTEERTNNKTPILNENQILHLTTPEPGISFKTTLGPIQKVKRFIEENSMNPKQNTDLRDKMEKSFKQILEKFPPFEAITSKPNTTTEVEKQDNEPKTYGMNLTGNHGYVWNELTNPGIGYNVGEKDASNTTDQTDTEPTTSLSTIENESENSSQPSTKITGSVTESPTTSKVSSNDKDVTTTISPVTTEVTSASTTANTNPETTEKASESTTESNPETTEIASVSTIESNPVTTENASETTTESNAQTTNITSESTTESNAQTTKITSESTTTESNRQSTKITSESTTTESNRQTTEEQPQTTEKQPETTETSSATTEQNVEDDKKENTNQEEDNNNKNPVQISFDELLKKDKFRDWLSNWTNTYIEVFNKYIEKMVKDEVAKQLKNYMNDKNSVKNVENNNNYVLQNKANNTDHDTNKKKENDGDNKTNAQDNGNYETNKDKKANKLGQKINQTPVNVKANSIYGGAVGNDRVTNIFIFNSNGQVNKTTQSFLDGIYHENSTSGNPVNTLDEIGNDDKDKNSETTISTILNEKKDRPDRNENSSTTISDQTEPSKLTSTTIGDLAEKDKDNENSDGIATDISTTESCVESSNCKDTSDNKNESTTAEDKSKETSDTTTVATTSNSISVATTVSLNGDVTENVSDINNSTVVPTSSSTTTFKSNVKEVENEEYDCTTTDPAELAKLEITIGDNIKDKNNDRKCIPKQKKPRAGLLAKLSDILKRPLKTLLNI